MTFIGYPNISARSEDGRYRLEIEGTAPGDFFRDQSGFVYRLFRLDKPLWEWVPKEDESGLADFPHEAWVSNEGWVIVRTHEWFRAGLLVLAPNGSLVFGRYHRSVLDGEESGFLDEEPEGYLGASSAGPFWARMSIAYFAAFNDRSCWTIRTWWGRRVVIDLEAARIVPFDPAWEPLARWREIQWIQKTFSEQIEKVETAKTREDLEESDDFWTVVNQLSTAAYHTGWLKAHESVPFLRRLEEAPHAGGNTGMEWADLHDMPLRRVAKLSLLRLGEEPRWFTHFQFELESLSAEEDPRSTEWFAFPQQVTNRSRDMIQLGLSQKELLQQLGAPDYIRDHWEYDFFSAAEKCTVQAHWHDPYKEKLRESVKSRDDFSRHYNEYKRLINEDPPRIIRIEVCEPAWNKITKRDHEIV